MRNNREYREDFFCDVNGIDVYCRDARENMECNWSNDYPWENRDAVEIYMSRRGFQLETRRAARSSRTPYMPSYNEMMTRIRMAADEPAEALQEFERVREFARATGKGYMMVRAWFLDRYELHPLLTAV